VSQARSGPQGSTTTTGERNCRKARRRRRRAARWREGGGGGRDSASRRSAPDLQGSRCGSYPSCDSGDWSSISVNPNARLLIFFFTLTVISPHRTWRCRGAARSWGRWREGVAVGRGGRTRQPAENSTAGGTCAQHGSGELHGAAEGPASGLGGRDAESHDTNGASGLRRPAEAVERAAAAG
jgi:hypothetical protein